MKYANFMKSFMLIAISALSASLYAEFREVRVKEIKNTTDRNVTILKNPFIDNHGTTRSAGVTLLGPHNHTSDEIILKQDANNKWDFLEFRFETPKPTPPPINNLEYAPSGRNDQLKLIIEEKEAGKASIERKGI